MNDRIERIYEVPSAREGVAALRAVVTIFECGRASCRIVDVPKEGR